MAFEICRFCSHQAVGRLAQSQIPVCTMHRWKIESVKAKLDLTPAVVLPDADAFRSIHEIADVTAWRESLNPIGPPMPREFWSVPKRDYGPRELDQREREYDRGMDVRQDLCTIPDRRTRRS